MAIDQPNGLADKSDRNAKRASKNMGWSWWCDARAVAISLVQPKGLRDDFAWMDLETAVSIRE